MELTDEKLNGMVDVSALFRAKAIRSLILESVYRYGQEQGWQNHSQ